MCQFHTTRRGFLAVSAATTLGMAGLTPSAHAQALTRAARDAMTPDQVLQAMKDGNKRFLAGKPRQRNVLDLQRATASGQYPKAVLLSCIDSRAPAEAILDMGIGDIFNSRIAGNVADEDVLGGMEFACAASGAKVVLVMGHTACGAVKGAIDDVKLGNLTALLGKIKPAIAGAQASGSRDSKNDAFVNAVARRHVELTLEQIRRNSPTLAELERKGSIAIRGSMYRIETGQVEFI